VPLVSVLLAAHNEARYVRLAVESVLRQTLRDLELIVIDDASSDETLGTLAAISDPRVVVLGNDERLGLAASLNRGLERATGRYVARLDADDVALPERLELQVARVEREPHVVIVGSAVLDLDEIGRPGRLHRMPGGPNGARWQALFSSPFFHPTVLVVRDVLESHGLRYDTALAESEDYELWTRLLTFGDGDNLDDALVLKRVHPGQATLRRGDLQRSLQRKVALREIAQLLEDEREAEPAWRGEPEAYLMLLERFEARYGVDSGVRLAAAKRLARGGHALRALRLGPTGPARVAVQRAQRGPATRAAQERASGWLSALAEPAETTRVVVVSPEPTPYRSPLFDRVAARPDVELTVIYAARTVARRTWSVTPQHPHLVLRGVSVPGARRLLHHDYPVTPGIARALRRVSPEVVVVSGWSTFASQTAIAWCRARDVPYIVLVESHDVGRRSRWRGVVKGAVVPPLLRGAAGTLVVGSLARDSVVARGAASDRVRVFANTIDVSTWTERADRLARNRRKLRSTFAFGDDDVVVLSVARLAREKGLDTLVRAVAAADDPRLALVVVGSGPDGSRLMALAEEHEVRLLLTGELPEDRVAEAYVAADVFALLSSRESWGVVVNEAAASGLPLVLSDQVGAARDLLNGNGRLVQPDDVTAAAAALRGLAADPESRRALGEKSRQVVRGWDYDASVEAFVAAVRDAAHRA